MMMIELLVSWVIMKIFDKGFEHLIFEFEYLKEKIADKGNLKDQDRWQTGMKELLQRLRDSEDPTVTSDLPEEARAEAAVLGEEVGVRQPPAEAVVVFGEIRVGEPESAEVLRRSVGRNGGADGGITGKLQPVLIAATPPVSVLSSTPASSVLVPTISTTLPVASVIKEETDVRPATEIDVVREEIRARDEEAARIRRSFAGRSGRADVEIKGTRPPVLTPPPPVSALSPSSLRPVLPPPPSMALTVHDRESSSWDIVRSFAPADENEVGDRRRSLDSDEEKDEVLERVLTCIDEDLSSTTTEKDEVLERDVMEGETSNSAATEFVISSNWRFKKKIRSWTRGRFLGSGSFGTVYEGINYDGTFFAVKEVSLLDRWNAQECILQFEQEIVLLSQFEHENIVQYYGTDKDESTLFIFLELVSQGSIVSLYKKYHLQDTQVSSYTRQILNGLNYLHERDVVHRDIKCANMLVHANGSIKLSDFGIAKISKFNDMKSFKGSAYWMAPEVVRSNKYGRAVDIWSLGCTVLEMLTRQIPFPNLEWQQALYKIGKGIQPPIPGYLSSAAQDFIRKCVQVDPNSRPSAAQLLEHPFVTSSLK